MPIERLPESRAADEEGEAETGVRPETVQAAEPSLEAERLERIARLIERMSGDRLDPGADETTVELRRQLRDEGEVAANYLIGLIEKAEEGDESLWVSDHYIDLLILHYINLLSLCATPANAEKVGEILRRESDKRADLTDGTGTAFQLLFILERIGTMETIPQIIEYFNKAMSISSLDENRKGLIASRVIYTIAAIDYRVYPQSLLTPLPDEENREKVITALSQINQELVNQNLENSPPPPEYYLNSYHPDTLYDYEAYFESRYESEDDYEDQELMADYTAGREYEVNHRLDVVKNLRSILAEETGTRIEQDPKIPKIERLVYKEDNPSPYAPTLGIEIEVRQQAFPEGEEWPYKFAKTESAGVPKGGDPAWEFAHQPAHHYLTLSREVQALIEMERLNKDYRKYALHLTIGGVGRIDKHKPGEIDSNALVLARALEASGWSTTGGRLLRPYHLGTSSWARAGRGRAGVNPRSSRRLGLGARTAIEIRTLQLQSLTGLNRLLRSAYYLGGALKAHEEREALGEEENQDPVKSQLQEVWQEFAEEVTRHFKEFNLPSPQSEDDWLHPVSFLGFPEEEAKVSAGGGFFALAELLDEARKDSESRGARFVAGMRDLIIRYRSKAKELMEPGSKLQGGS